MESSTEIIKKEMNILYKELTLARIDYRIASDIDYLANDSKYSKVLVPIIDSLYASVITKTNNIFHDQSNCISLNYVLKDIKNSFHAVDEYINSIMEKMQYYDDIIKKLFISRSNIYDHLNKKCLLSKNNCNFKMKYKEIEELLNLAKEILDDIYSNILKENIIYTNKDEEIISIEIQKIISLLK